MVQMLRAHASPANWAAPAHVPSGTYTQLGVVNPEPDMDISWKTPVKSEVDMHVLNSTQSQSLDTSIEWSPIPFLGYHKI